MTPDVCKVLDLQPDTLRYRLRKGTYPEPKQKAGDKRRFTVEEIKEIIQITGEFPRKKWKPRK
ncbi:MAG: MerR family transcriptional regulator [Deltaproteobacteria bacterium]|nr:MerR family transcriptional regulator [Deltaproteobacteria bacterium]